MANKHIGPSIADHIREKKGNKDFEEHFERAKLIGEIAQQVYELRIKEGLSQQEIADKACTTQPVIARLESGKDSRVPSLELLNKIARAAKKDCKISFS